MEKLFGLGVTRQFGFAFFLFYPVDGVYAVTVDGHVETFLFQQGKSVDNGEEFADIVGSIHRPEVKDFLTAGDVYSPVLHGTGISAAGGVYGKAVFCDGGRKGSVGAGIVLAGEGADRLMYAYGEEAKAFSASSRDSNDLYFAPS